MAALDPSAANVTRLPLFDRDAGDAAGLVAIIRRLTVARSIAEIMEIVTQAARNLLGADGVTFVLRDGELCHYAEEDAISPLWKGERFPLDACISGWCMERGEAVWIPDVYQDDRIPHDAYRPTFVRSLAMAPVRQEQPIAALGAYWREAREFSAEHLELLQTVANAAALALALVNAKEQGDAAAFHAARPRARPGQALRRAWDRFVFRLDLAARSFQHAATSGIGGAPGSRLIRGWLSKPPTAQSYRILTGLIFTVLAWLARSAMSPLMGDESPYAFFVPAVLVASIHGGRTAGVTAMLAGGVLGNLAFVGHSGQLELAGGHFWALLSFWAPSVFIIIVADAMARAMRREAVLNHRLEVIRGELQHRIKNIVTIAQALARQTARNTSGVAQFEAALGERLETLAQAQVLLLEQNVRGAELSTLAGRILAPFAGAARVEISGGPAVSLNEHLAVSLALLLNELATNATKYGALSGSEGRVQVWWTRDHRAVHLHWVERGGPPVHRPEKAGFGSRLLRSALPAAQGACRIHYDPVGVRCDIDLVCPEPGPAGPRA